MVTQFTPVAPGWDVVFHCDDVEVTYPVLGWVFVPGDDGWEADPVIWMLFEAWDAQAAADHLKAKAYNVVPA